MKKSLLLLSLAVAAAGPAEARTLSPAEALARANKSPQEVTGTSRAGNVTPVMTVGEAQAPAIYLFNQVGEGYIVLSADDVAAPVLGYSDSGAIDPSNLSPTMRWWLGEYKAQIELAASQGAGSYAPVSRASRAAIAPLLKTRWDQDAPYNNLCPKIGSERTVTGCVATAMAQVMKYHNWPATASNTANFRYEWTRNNFLSADYRDHAFNWSDMLDAYRSGGYTTSQASAVAELMQACGYSVEMNYNVSSVGGSGASSEKVGGALVNYFKYDCGLRNEPRMLYTSSEWETLIYNDLVANGPVLYAGNSNAGGHCFVCDGYLDGYFHFDWGWSGTSNGYFLLNALDPDEQGIGGSTGGFNMGQMALLGVKPSTDGKTTPVYKFVCEGLLSASISGYDLTILGNFSNYSTALSVSGNIEFLFKDASGNVLKKFSTPVSDFDQSIYYPELSIRTGYIGLSAGTYRVYPVFTLSNGETYPFLCSPSQAGYIEVTKSASGTWSVSVPGSEDFSIVDQDVKTGFYLNSEFFVTGATHFTGSVESDASVVGVLMEKPDASTVIGIGDELNLTFTPGVDTPFDYLSYWFTILDDKSISLSVSPGDYYFAFASEFGGRTKYRLLSTPVKVKVNAEPSGIGIGKVTCDVENATAVDPDNVTVNVNVECTEGVLYDWLMVAVFDKNMANVGQYRTDVSIVDAGHTGVFTANFKMENAVEGEKYSVCPYIWNNQGWTQLTNVYTPFTIGERSGIADVIADGGRKISASPNPAVDYTLITASAQIRNVLLVALSGAVTGVQPEIDGMTARLDLSSLPSGLYLARVTTAEGAETVKIIKK